MDKAGESKDFSISLTKRIEHLRRRKERSEAYCATERSKLDAEQLKVAQSREEIDGMLKEAERAEKAYRVFADRKNDEDQQRRQQDFERGQQSAQLLGQQARVRDFTIVSDFLRLVSQQYVQGGAQCSTNPLSRTDVAALVTVLHAMYSGGQAGAETMTKLVDGSEETVGSMPVTYQHLQNLVPISADDSENECDSSASEFSTEETSGNESSSNSEPAEIKPEVKADPKPEPKVDPKPEPKVDPKPEPKVDLKPEPKVDPKPEPKVDPKPEVKADAAAIDAAKLRPTSYADVVAMGPSNIPKPASNGRSKEPELRSKSKPRTNAQRELPRPSKPAEIPVDRQEVKLEAKAEMKPAKVDEKNDENDGGFQVVTRNDRSRRKFRSDKK